jgi:hypothetical protein
MYPPFRLSVRVRTDLISHCGDLDEATFGDAFRGADGKLSGHAALEQDAVREAEGCHEREKESHAQKDDDHIKESFPGVSSGFDERRRLVFPFLM